MPAFKCMVMPYGVMSAPGIVIGKAFVISSESLIVEQRTLQEGEVEDEIKRFERALAETREELLNIKSRIAEQMGENHAKIFDMQLMILEDPTLSQNTTSTLRK